MSVTLKLSDSDALTIARALEAVAAAAGAWMEAGASAPEGEVARVTYDALTTGLSGLLDWPALCECAEEISMLEGAFCTAIRANAPDLMPKRAC